MVAGRIAKAQDCKQKERKKERNEKQENKKIITKQMQ